jgi:RNA polymerase sigma factor (sigma-70 family)
MGLRPGRMSNRIILTGWRKRWNLNLLRFLGSRVPAVDIEDLAQETYLRLLRARDLREVRNPQAYLIRVASHVVGEWRHGELPTAARTSLDDDLLIDERTPEFEVDARVSQERLEQLLATFSPMMRAVLLLRLRDDRANKDIAAALGLTDRQVKRHLARGYDRLRQALVT